MAPDHKPEVLEVEDAEQRQRRLQAILGRLNVDGPSTAIAESPNLSFDFGVRQTFSIEPPTEPGDLTPQLISRQMTVLAKVRQFLPQIEQSNAVLSQMDPRNIDIEHIEETDERVIEMNLGLGVFEQRRTRSHSTSSSSSETSSAASERPNRATRDSSPASSDSSSSSSSSISSDSEDDEDNDSSSHSSRPIRPLPRRANAMIEVLASRDEEDSSAGDLPVP